MQHLQMNSAMSEIESDAADSMPSNDSMAPVVKKASEKDPNVEKNSSKANTTPEHSKIVVQKKVVTKDCFDVITRTLTGLMNMYSVVKKLKNKTIIIKIIERSYNHDLGDYSKSVSYCTGYMVREYKLNEEADNFSESWRFIPDTNAQDTILGEDNMETVVQGQASGPNSLKKIVNLTIQITVNPEGSRTTRVIINPPNMYKCKDCARSFRTSSALKLHASEHSSSPNLECKPCSMKFKGIPEARDHFLHGHRVEDNKGMYECMECNKRFGSSLLLRKHMEMHFGKSVNCLHCNKCFSSSSDLRKHLPVHRGVTVPQSPFTTSQETSEVSQGNESAKTKQGEQKIYCCYICRRQFSRFSNLQRHIEIHQGEGAMYKCAICNCSYHYVSSLTRHVVTCHVDTKNKRVQKVGEETKDNDTIADAEEQFLQEDQIVEMINLEEMSAENLQYVTGTIEDVTGGLNVEEGVEILQIPADVDTVVLEG